MGRSLGVNSEKARLSCQKQKTVLYVYPVTGSNPRLAGCPEGRRWNALETIGTQPENKASFYVTPKLGGEFS